jgi:hypothetical protein
VKDLERFPVGQIRYFAVLGIPRCGGLGENRSIDAVRGRHAESYSSDLRIRVIRAVEDGFSARGRVADWVSASRRRPPGLVAGGTQAGLRPSRRRGAAARR